MTNYNVYQEMFDTHQNFFDKYIKHFLDEKNDADFMKFSNWRLSYINYISDVNLLYKIIS
jgi:hypothetical protein